MPALTQNVLAIEYLLTHASYADCLVQPAKCWRRHGCTMNYKSAHTSRQCSGLSGVGPRYACRLSCLAFWSTFPGWLDRAQVRALWGLNFSSHSYSILLFGTEASGEDD